MTIQATPLNPRELRSWLARWAPEGLSVVVVDPFKEQADLGPVDHIQVLERDGRAWLYWRTLGWIGAGQCVHVSEMAPPAMLAQETLEVMLVDGHRLSFMYLTEKEQAAYDQREIDEAASAMSLEAARRLLDEF
jgi:hypothetical protein